MAKYNQGILGGFEGTVGTIVGYYRCGMNIMRARARHVKDRKSLLQLIARLRFTLIVHFVLACLAVVRLGFPKRNVRYSAYNAAVKANFAADVFVGSGLDIALDYSKMVISAGHGVLPGSPTAQVGAGNTVQIEWTDNSGISPEVLSTDHVVACLYDPAREGVAYDVSTAVRGDESLVIAYPALWAGDEAYLYLFMTNSDNTMASPSMLVATLSLT